MQQLITRFTICLTWILFAAVGVHAQSGTLEATVIARKGKILTLKPISQSGESFENGMEADMSKYFEEKMGQMTMNGWLTVAKVKFIPTTHQNIDIQILEEKSDITVNGEKVDHFKIGKRMKLEWPAEVAAPAEEGQ
jgi:hypothetical protein